MPGEYHGIQVYDKLAHIRYGVSCQSVIINYISEHQLPHVIDASQSRSYVIETDRLEILSVF